MLTVGGLFSGIGGWELGLERAGMRVLWHCEAEPYARRVLEQHWPDIPCYPDVRELRGADVEPVDVIAGGFPCQDISFASANVNAPGINGARSGLWSEMFRLVRELRPRYLLVENVPALLVRGVDVVLGDLAAIGYDAEWDCLPASAFGAPHRRDRIWLVAYPNGDGEPDGAVDGQARGGATPVGDPDRVARAQTVAGHGRPGTLAEPGPVERIAWSQRGPWSAEPDVGRVADGVPARVDRLRCLGNALVPQISEWIGRRIIDYEGGLT